MSDRTLREGGTIYVTSHVCFGCAKLIANSGLARVVIDTDRADAHRNPLASYQFLVQCGIIVNLSDLVMMSRLAAELERSGDSLKGSGNRIAQLYLGFEFKDQ